MAIIEQFPSQDKKRTEEQQRLFDRVALGMEHIHQQTNIAGQLKALEDDPEQWHTLVDLRLKEIQRWVSAMADSEEKRKSQDSLEALSVLLGQK